MLHWLHAVTGDIYVPIKKVHISDVLLYSFYMLLYKRWFLFRKSAMMAKVDSFFIKPLELYGRPAMKTGCVFPFLAEESCCQLTPVIWPQRFDYVCGSLPQSKDRSLHTLHRDCSLPSGVKLHDWFDKRGFTIRKGNGYFNVHSFLSKTVNIRETEKKYCMNY